MARPNFHALGVLPNSSSGLVHSPGSIRRALLHQRQEQRVHKVSEESLRMLDAYGTAQDVLLLVKKQLKDLQFTFSRGSIGEPEIGNRIAAYNLGRKTLKIETLNRLNSLKGMKIKGMRNKCINLHLSSIDDNLKGVVNVLKEVRMTAISIMEVLLSLISISWLDPKSAKCSFASRLVRLNRHRLNNICDLMALQDTNKRLEAVEIAIEDLEAELECMFRRLIQTRVSLLNILTN
ncbi:uncharacterized protein LOC121260020 [Juglans microcarpa x Juglans regia]|uniref:uncharacterized protein LOC121260020 n=1 Tax=Juglans microcarpa x Juglans regia TaxID=2249226 RepID=UPI001B7F3F50|nr:uncharacterized protein LOC121260020 [Juglans microcarpa x Juglans regia]